ncbi:MAG: hypothetical protein A3E25_12175 [Burkholderiales bacterium RIFCSPHIGHO2_12_FULL_69_20]|nr:MAG: hypothetical protein A3E25_12175 [Burkholderiales bacterium RIFCSPHIGHO2_12_FULL_69_20]
MPMVNLFTFQLVALVSGVLYGLLALTVWSLLHHRHHALPVNLWTAGSLTMGTGVSLFAARGLVPDWASYGAANNLMGLAMALGIMALRVDLGHPLRAGRLLLVWLLSSGGYWLCMQSPGEAPRVYYGSVMLILGTLAFGWHAAAAGRHTPSRSGLVLAAVEGLLVAVLALRLGLMLAGWAPARGISDTWDFALVACVTVVSSLYGNLAYLGMVLDRTRAIQQRASEAQLAESLRREAAEQQAAALRGLLAQRDQLAAERQQLLQLLAHEIRQPLHNASGALQAARSVLDAPQAGSNQRASERLQRAQVVLGDVRSVLDNTLAAASLLSGGDALYAPDTDIDFLIDLTLGDLPEAQRHRVSVVWRDQLRSAEFEIGLARLALRNLLRNAFSHGGPEVSVLICVEEQPSPPALVISVIDDGVGPPPDLLQPPTATGGPTPAQALAQRGLGLYIVRQVMARHGGTLELSANLPQGLVARLVFPQAVVDVVDHPLQRA